MVSYLNQYLAYFNCISSQSALKLASQKITQSWHSFYNLKFKSLNKIETMGNNRWQS